jgi:predicted Zn-dependent peptidase
MLLRANLYGFIGLILLLTQPLSAGYELINAPDRRDPMQVHIYRLDNGLSVYLTENHEEPRFYAEIAVRAGSKHDPAEATGIAHYLEHMMLFKGSQKIGSLDYEQERVHLDSIETLYERRFSTRDEAERRAIYALINEQSQLAARHAVPGEIQRLYNSMGSKSVKAHTSVEETVYRVDLPSNRFTHWARTEAERFSKPVFRLFQTELETVYEEKNRSMDNKDRLISEAVRGLLYKLHPYGQRTTLGSVEHLKNPSLKRMREYYETYYVPNNMAVLVSGDIEIAQAIEVIDAEFSLWAPRQLPKVRRWKEAKLTKREQVSVSYPGEEYVLIAFRTEASTHKNTEALQLLDMTLDNTTAGLININLNQKQAVQRAGSYSTSHSNRNDYGAQYLWGIPKQDQTLEEVEQLLLDQVTLLRNGEFEDWIVPAIITDFDKTRKRGLEKNGSRVGLMRQAYLGFEDWEDTRLKVERMRALDEGAIKKMARKYFSDGYVVGFRRDGEAELPSIDKPEIQSVDIEPGRQSVFVAEILDLPVEELEPVYIIPGRDYSEAQVVPGVNLYYARNPLNDLFSLEMSVDLGTLADSLLSVSPELMDKSGTHEFNAEELKKQWYRLGTDFTFAVDDYESRVWISGLDGNFARSLEISMDLLRQPTAPDSTLAELTRIIIARRQDQAKDHNAISKALIRFNRHGEMSSFLRAVSNAGLSRLSVARLHASVRALLSYRHTISYSGSLPIESVLTELRRHYKGVGAGDLKEPPPFRPLLIREPEATQVYFFNKEMAQALVRIESGDGPYNETRRPAIDLYNEYFDGGTSAIVFQELREARALAYSAGARYLHAQRADDPNLMVAVLGCQADKTPEALETFIGLLDEMPESPERFDAAQAGMINQYRTSRLDFRRILTEVRKWNRQGVAVDPRAWRLEQIQRGSLEGMLEVYRERIQGRPKLISIVGNSSKFDLASLAQYGEITELGVEDIFSY